MSLNHEYTLQLLYSVIEIKHDRIRLECILLNVVQINEILVESQQLLS